MSFFVCFDCRLGRNPRMLSRTIHALGFHCLLQRTSQSLQFDFAIHRAVKTGGSKRARIKLPTVKQLFGHAPLPDCDHRCAQKRWRHPEISGRSFQTARNRVHHLRCRYGVSISRMPDTQIRTTEWSSDTPKNRIHQTSNRDDGAAIVYRTERQRHAPRDHSRQSRKVARRVMSIDNGRA